MADDDKEPEYMAMLGGKVKQSTDNGAVHLDVLDSGVKVQTQMQGEVKVTIMVFPDGTQYQHSDDGTKIHQYADKSRWDRLADGTTKETMADESVVQTRPMGDGLVETITKEPDGTKTLETADGITVVEKPDGTKIQTMPDGTTITL